MAVNSIVVKEVQINLHLILLLKATLFKNIFVVNPTPSGKPNFIVKECEVERSSRYKYYKFRYFESEFFFISNDCNLSIRT
jgi:hypothetical protein